MYEEEMWPMYNPNKNPKNFKPSEPVGNQTLKKSLSVIFDDSRWCKVDLDFYLNRDGSEEALKRIEEKRTRTVELDNRYEDLAWSIQKQTIIVS